MKNNVVMRLLPRPLLIVVLVVLLAIVLLPLTYIVLASLNNDASIARGDLWPESWSISNYIDIWRTTDLAGGLLNSLIIAGATGVVSAVLAVGTAYVLVRYTFVGRITILRSLLGLQSIPGTLMLLPIFVLYSSVQNVLDIDIIGTRWGVFLTYLTFALPFSTWVLVTYMRGLPRELEEAARIDGASNLGVLMRIIVPLSWPGIVVSGIFAFLLGWNDILFASVMTNPDSATAAVVLQLFGSAAEGGAVPPYGQMMAAALISAAPVVTLYMIFQRQLVGGLTAGGVK